MKYKRTRTPQRTDALFLALDWYLTDLYDKKHAREYIQEAEDGPWYSQDELQASLARRYAGRFRKARLRKKHFEDLYWLERSKQIDWKRFEQ